MKTNLTFAALAAVGFALATLSAVAQAPTNMALIPPGSFTMGDAFNDGVGGSGSPALPLHTVSVSTFYMDKYEVTKALWDTVKTWATTNGYGFDNAGSGKAANHPVHTVSWYDSVKWCNARSQKEGRTPAYYTDAALTQVYKTGPVTPYVNWNAGYRLPTEAEWEKAARGGASGHRFPWSDVETISHSQANYQSDGLDAYDVSPTRGFHPTFNDGVLPYTSPVGYFAANGYGLYDMAGNVFEMCWDWDGAYSSGSQTDPRGPSSGTFRGSRGGSFGSTDGRYRVAYRNFINAPSISNNARGFRSVLPPGQPSVVPGQSIVVPGGSLTLNLIYTLDVPSTYQWQFNGTNLPGATSSTLALSNLTLDQSGPYSVVVSNAYEVVTATAAQVQVVDRVTISGQPRGATVISGTNVSLSVTAVSPLPITYQWQLNGTDLPNQTNATLTLSNVQFDPHTGDYRVRVSDTSSNVWSETATLIVLVRPTITSQPVAQTVLQGGTAVFSVSATPDHPLLPLNYRWVRQGVNFLSNAPPMLVLTNVQPGMAGSFRVTVTNLAGSANSTAVNLTVLPDFDRDGMADAWEKLHGFDTNSVADALLDFDDDRMSNRDEYAAGTNPTNAASVLKLQLAPHAVGATALTFLAISNRTYSVEWNTQLTGDTWSNLMDVLAQPADRIGNVTDTNAGGPMRFYRVVTPRRP